MIEFYVCHPGDEIGILWRFKPNGENNHVKKAGVVLPVTCCPGKGKLSIHLVHPGNPRPYDIYAVFLLGSLPGIVKALSHGTHVHEKDGYIQIRLVLLGNRGLLYCIHATYRGTVTVSAGLIP